MKKVLAILAMTAVFAACNNESTVEAEAKRVADSTHTADSLKKVADDAEAAAKAAMPDTTKPADTLKK